MVKDIDEHPDGRDKKARHGERGAEGLVLVLSGCLTPPAPPSVLHTHYFWGFYGGFVMET